MKKRIFRIIISIIIATSIACFIVGTINVHLWSSTEHFFLVILEIVIFSLLEIIYIINKFEVGSEEIEEIADDIENCFEEKPDKKELFFYEKEVFYKNTDNGSCYAIGVCINNTNNDLIIISKNSTISKNSIITKKTILSKALDMPEYEKITEIQFWEHHKKTDEEIADIADRFSYNAF